MASSSRVAKTKQGWKRERSTCPVNRERNRKNLDKNTVIVEKKGKRGTKMEKRMWEPVRYWGD